MSVRQGLTALARGDSPARGFLLQTCRLETDGVEEYGEEAIVAAFRAAPLDLSGGAWIVGDGGAAVIGPAGGLFADIVSNRVARLYRLEPGEPSVRAADTPVAFDPDLAQAPADAPLEPAIFGSLSHDRTVALAAAAQAIARDWRVGGGPAYRARVVPLRAFEAPEGAAALFVISWATGGPVRSVGFSPAAAILPTGKSVLTCPPRS